MRSAILIFVLIQKPERHGIVFHDGCCRNRVIGVNFEANAVWLGKQSQSSSTAA